MNDHITSLDALRALYAAPKERSVKKQLAALDGHCRSFIGLAPFLVLATHSGSGDMDASPRGGGPGFVKVPDEHTLLIPDAPGNNRLDSLENIVATGRAGLLFLVPGVDESLRVNGTALLSRAPADLAVCTDERRTPTLVIRVRVHEAYLHCAKALMRSGLWREGSRIERSRLPTMGQMLHDQTGAQTPVETQEAMLQRYAADL
jgi:uncharacterized protein